MMKSDERIPEDLKLMGGPEEIPLNALEYHRLWDDMTDKGLVNRKLLCCLYEEDRDYPVYLYHMEPYRDYLNSDYERVKRKLYRRPKILVTSGVHGSEKAAPVILKNLIEDMMRDPELAAIASRYEWDIIPLVNPWGYSHSILIDGKIHNGQFLESLEGYDVTVIENGEYNQGVRVNKDWLDLNRNWHDGPEGCPGEEQKLLRDVFIKGGYDMVLDIHQSKKNVACGFISMGNRPDSMPEEEYEKNYAAFCNAVVQAGIETDRLVSRYYGLNSLEQLSFPWKGPEGANFRNYASGYTAEGKREINHKNPARYSLCIEMSMYGQALGGDEEKIKFNEKANTYGNTFLHNFIKRLDNLI